MGHLQRQLEEKSCQAPTGVKWLLKQKEVGSDGAPLVNQRFWDLQSSPSMRVRPWSSGCSLVCSRECFEEKGSPLVKIITLNKQLQRTRVLMSLSFHATTNYLARGFCAVLIAIFDPFDVWSDFLTEECSEGRECKQWWLMLIFVNLDKKMFGDFLNLARSDNLTYSARSLTFLAYTTISGLLSSGSLGEKDSWEVGQMLCYNANNSCKRW